MHVNWRPSYRLDSLKLSSCSDVQSLKYVENIMLLGIDAPPVDRFLF